MKPSYKFVRVVLGATVGAVIWAGCASELPIAHDPAGARVERERKALDWQENLTVWRADTHPEWRTGWNMAFPNPPYCDPTVDDLSVAVEQPIDTPPQSR